MTPSDFTTLLDEIHGYIRSHIAAGFTDADSIIELTTDMYSDQADPLILRPHVCRFVENIIAAHLVEQASWPAITDCDRLDATFAALEASGILCRQHFSCCGTCGSAEIWDEIAAAQKTGMLVRGYAFYHIQDTDSAMEGHGLYLNYGATEKGEAAALSVARDVVAGLEQHGLRVNWNGHWSQRIGVALDWKRRWEA